MKRFILLYVIYMIIAFILVDYKPVHDFLRLDEIYTTGVVFLSHYLIELIGIDVRVEGAYLHLASAVMEVKFGCNGLEAILLLLAAILAYPASMKAKLLGIILGSTFLQFFNIIRIAMLAWVLEYHPVVFPIMHEYITQSIMIAIAFVIFLVYLQNVTRHEKLKNNS
ncbi:MAG: archaeosortase/exosortase family protein [Campylobacterota bacterium]|nr:archaeosortase/exosortase family protein [Campylobacterota bacterium]